MQDTGCVVDPPSGQARYGTDIDAGAVVEPSARAQLQHAEQLCRAGQHAAAEGCLRAALSLAPNWPMAHNNLGWVLQAQGHNEQALACYNAALQLDPQLSLAQRNLAYLLANLYFFIGKFAEARSMWRYLAACFPHDPDVLDHLINCALRVNDLTDAADWATRYAQLPNAGPQPRLTRGKVQHDLAQLRYLQARGLLGEGLEGLITEYAALGERLDRHDPAADAAQLGGAYGRIIHHAAAPRLPGHAVPRSAATRRAEQDYLDSALGIVVIDDFLSAEALAQLQRFCLESTVWHRNGYAHDRLGAFFRDGFNCPLLLQVAEELQQVFPRVIGLAHPLLQLWGFKYRHDQPATPAHADFAAVNVNFWITPDAANLDHNSGGLLIYDVEAPPDWDFDAYNRDGQKIADYLQAVEAKPMAIPYRCNRAVIFNSDLFHATAPLAFRPGYANQRINITLLYGEREFADTP